MEWGVVVARNSECILLPSADITSPSRFIPLALPNTPRPNWFVGRAANYNICSWQFSHSLPWSIPLFDAQEARVFVSRVDGYRSKQVSSSGQRARAKHFFPYTTHKKQSAEHWFVAQNITLWHKCILYHSYFQNDRSMLTSIKANYFLRLYINIKLSILMYNCFGGFLEIDFEGF